MEPSNVVLVVVALGAAAANLGLDRAAAGIAGQFKRWSARRDAAPRSIPRPAPSCPAGH